MIRFPRNTYFFIPYYKYIFLLLYELFERKPGWRFTARYAYGTTIGWLVRGSAEIGGKKCRKLSFEEFYYWSRGVSVEKLLDIDIYFLWSLYLEKKKIDLAIDSEKRLYSEMKKQNFPKWAQYNERLRAKKEKKELLERVSKKAGVNISKVHLKNWAFFLFFVVFFFLFFL